jgi:agmatinase
MTRPAFLDEAPADVESARILVLPCPYDGTSTYAKGADRGPEALLRASPQLEPFDVELGRRPCDAGIAVLDPVVFADQDPARAVESIQAAARLALAMDRRFVVGVGGEHSVSVGLTRALRERRGRFHVLHIDAHADLRDQYEGSPFNHACVMRRIAEDDRDARIASVGIRACCEEEIEYGRRRGIATFFGHAIAEGSDWQDDVLRHLESPLYVTVDLDGLDPSILPSTGTPVPGGLGWYETLSLLRRVGEAFEVIGCDLTELKPDPVNHHSEFLAAQLAYKMMGYFVRG